MKISLTFRTDAPGEHSMFKNATPRSSDFPVLESG